jgi:hypothetical protein
LQVLEQDLDRYPSECSCAKSKCGGFVVEESRQTREWEEFISMTRRPLSTRM